MKMAAVDKTGVFPFSVCVSGKISDRGEQYSSIAGKGCRMLEKYTV